MLTLFLAIVLFVAATHWIKRYSSKGYTLQSKENRYVIQQDGPGCYSLDVFRELRFMAKREGAMSNGKMSPDGPTFKEFYKQVAIDECTFIMAGTTVQIISRQWYVIDDQSNNICVMQLHQERCIWVNEIIFKHPD